MDSVYVPFNGSLPTQGGTWVDNSLIYGNSITCPGTSCSKSPEFYIGFNGLGDFIRTPLITQTARFSFSYKRSNNNTGHRIIVETSPNGTTWTTRLNIVGVGTTYRDTAIQISNVFVRIRDQRDSTTSTRIWYLDDVKWTYENKVGVWKGGISSDWNNSLNWCKSTLPTITDNVIIPSGTPFSPVINSGTANVKDITLNAGATLTNNATLRIAGIINSTAQINSLNGTIELIGATTQNINGNNFTNKIVGNLKISNTSVNIQTDTLKIKNSITLSTNAILNTNNFLYLLSSDSVTARVGKMPSGARIIGNTSVERYCFYNSTWKLIGIPTIGQTVNASFQEGNTPMGNVRPGYGTIITSNVSNPTSFGFDRYSPNGPSMKYYVQATGTYQDIGNTSNLINTQTGYFLFVRGDRSVNTLGMTATKTILRTRGQLYTPIDNPPPVINVTQDKFTSVNNFYASAVNFGSLLRTGGVQNTFYLWDPQLIAPTVSAYGLGAFQTFVWDGSNYTCLPGGGSYSSGNNSIESGSAFFVKASSSDGTLTFTEDAKVETNKLVNKPIKNSSIRINFSVFIDSIPTLLDGAICQFGNFSNSVDKDDVLKISNNEGISILRNSNSLVGEFRQTISNFDTIPLNLIKLKKRTYQFDFNVNNLKGVKSSLVDRYTQTETELINKSTYKFSVTDDTLSSHYNRFFIKFYRVSQVVNVPSFVVSPNPTNTNQVKLDFDGLSNGKYNLSVVDNYGKLVKNMEFIYFGSPIELKLPNNLTNGLFKILVNGSQTSISSTFIMIK